MPVFYGSNVADSSLVTACDMATNSGGSETTVQTTFTNNLNHYAEAYSQGGTSIGSFASIPTTPTGHGWVYAPGIGAFDAGNWSAQVAFNDSQGPSPIDDITLRFFRNSGSSYTLLGSIVVTSPTLQTTRTDITFPDTALASQSFAAGELVYVDIWYHNTVASGGAGNITDISPAVYVGTSNTAGVANDMQITVPNWIGDTVDPFIVLLYGSNVADATLPNARKMSTVTGGTEVLNTAMTWTTSNAFGEITSAGGTIASAASIPATPTGRGWVYDPGPGAGTFALGNWSASIASTDATGPSIPTDITLRFFKYSGGTYTSIGNIVLLAPTIDTTRSVLTFPGTSMSSVTFAVGDMIYCDLWYHTTDVTTDHPALNVSNSATAGVANDMQVTTSIFTPLVVSPRPTGEVRPRWVMRAITGGIFQPFIPILAWVERGLTASFVRPTTPVTIPHYVRRSLTNVLLNYGLNISTRFRLMSANQLKDIATRFRLAIVKDISTRFILISGSTQSVRDIASRFRLMSANQLKDVATRFRLKSADQLKDIQSRFRLMSANQLKDIVTRFRLKSADQLKDIVSRFRLKSADQQKDVASRFRLMSANQLKDIVSRFRLKSADQLKDITTRFILATPGQRLKDITSRFRLKSADQLKDIASRFRLKSADQLKDVQSRFRLMSANQLKDIVSRFRLMSANQVKDVASRFRLRSANQLKDIQSRLRMMSANQLKDISTRLRLKSANQLRDIASRFILHGVGAFSNRDIATRFVLSVPSNAIWITRDGRISWLTRDDKAAWDTRDDLAAWKTR